MYLLNKPVLCKVLLWVIPMKIQEKSSLVYTSCPRRSECPTTCWGHLKDCTFHSVILTTKVFLWFGTKNPWPPTCALLCLLNVFLLYHYHNYNILIFKDNFVRWAGHFSNYLEFWAQSSPYCKVITGFLLFYKNTFQGLFQDFSRTQIDISRTPNLTLNPFIPKISTSILPMF